MINQANYENSLSDSVPHMSWVIRDASLYPNGLSDVENEVITQQCWAAVVINANATSAWTAALAAGDASYDPTGAIGIYVQSARFYQVVLNYVEAIVRSNDETVLKTRYLKHCRTHWRQPEATR